MKAEVSMRSMLFILAAAIVVLLVVVGIDSIMFGGPEGSFSKRGQDPKQLPPPIPQLP